MFSAKAICLVRHDVNCHRAVMTNYFRCVFWLAVFTTLAFAWMPHPPTLIPNDKLQHTLAFVVLALLVRVSYPTLGAQVTALALAGLGALIEVVQAIPALHRDCDIYDWYADVAAIFLGLMIAALLRLLQESRGT